MVRWPVDHSVSGTPLSASSHLLQQQQEHMTMLTTRMARTSTATAPAEATTGTRGKGVSMVVVGEAVVSVGEGPTESWEEGRSN